MATLAPSNPNHNEATEMMKKLSVETQPKALDDSSKKTSVDSGNGKNGQNQSNDRSMTPFLQDFMDPSLGYMPNYHPSYYFGGYDGGANPEGVDLSQGVFGDNGGLMYPHFYPYGPYSPAASPVPSVGHDGQLYGAQQYQYPAPLYQPLNATSPPYNPAPAAPVKADKLASAATDKDKSAPLAVETAKGNANATAKGESLKRLKSAVPAKQTYQNSTFNSNSTYGKGGVYPSSGFQDPRFGLDGMRSPIPWFDMSSFPDGQPRPAINGSMGLSVPNGNNAKNQSFQPHSPFMGFQPRPLPGLNSNGYLNKMYPSKYGNYGNTYRSAFPFGSNFYDSRNGRGLLAVDNKYKPRGRSNGLYGGYGNENMDGLNELNRGPRARNTKNQKGLTPIALAVKGQNTPLSLTADEEKDNKTSAVPDREQYNKQEFPDTYASAKFYIIKSYSEDDIHKSIKYGVWSSTPNGNKRLDAAYQEAQQKPGGCPVFLLFSVNTSGQFVGAAEMTGPVDFDKNFEYWQQDKWSGFFPVKWHIVKDVSNSLLKHITLENNENKPVTNSRDTQEVKLEHGLQMLKIFKEHSSRTCILDDFPFYEGRQKTIQEKKTKQQFTKQIWEGKPTSDEKEGFVNGVLKPHNSLEPSSADLVKKTTAIPANGDVTKISENGSLTKVAEAPKSVLKSTAEPERKAVVNGIANGVVQNGC